MKKLHKEKKQKHKKKKKKDHKKRKYEQASSDSKSSDSDQWVEAPITSTCEIKKKEKHDKSSSDSDSPDPKNVLPEMPPAEKRDSWMNDESFVPTLSKEEMFHSSSRQKRLEALREQKEKEEKVKDQRELNPHWKNDGKGLPDKESDVASLSLPSTSVGDGGYSWLKKAYYRIQQTAQQEGRSMEEVAAERWGSLNKLETLIKEAEERMNTHPDQAHFRKKYKYEYERSGASSRERQFKKPHESNEYQRKQSFASPCEFKKPCGDKKHKLLNQFKSSRTKFSNYKMPEEDNDRSNKLNEIREKRDDRCEEFNKIREKSSENISSSDKGNRIPAWKKPKYTKEKLLENETSSSSSIKISPTLTEKSVVKCNETAAITDEIPIIYSGEDLNRLAARQIKAEMMGDTPLALKLQQQLEIVRAKIKVEGFAKKKSKQEEVILTKLDSQGQARPIQVSEDKMLDYKNRKSKKYFDEESKYSLKQMFEREKLTTADDQMEMFVEVSSKYDDASEIDFELGKVSKKLTQNMNADHEEEKDIGKAIRHHQKHSAALEKCEYCLDKVKQHLLVEIGELVYLCLPNYQCLTEGHCLIVPKKHASSFLFLDENEWREIKDFKRSLRNLFEKEGKSVIFLETSLNFRYYPHAVLECIPVPQEDGDMAPFYFKKAIQESEYEWAHNKKLIDLTNKDLQHSVPKNLPYFHVEFDPKTHAGYAHVIEEEKHFPRNFGKEVLGGMLDIDYNHLFKNKREDPLKKSKEVVKFEKKWNSFKT